MSFITLKCKNCGSQMTLNTESHSATCTHCGSTFLLADLLDEQDLQFASSTSGKDLEKKMYAGEELKKGDTCLFQANYTEAEQHFKKAIEYDDKNYRAYLGVVKAKTHNLNIIPETDDYLEYAKCALRFASFEDEVYVKSELAKIELLKREDIRQKKAKKAKARHEEYKKNKKRQINKFFTKITIIISVLFLIGILIGNYWSKLRGLKDVFSAPIQISSVDDFMEKVYDPENLSKTFDLKADLDFQNSSYSPVGTTAKPFSGKFYGNGHTIKNVKIAVEDKGIANNYGLFGVLSNATVSNLILDTVCIDAQTDTSPLNTNCYGTLAGRATNSTIKNIYTTKLEANGSLTSSCEISIANGELQTAYIGGLVGKIDFDTEISHVAISTFLSLDLSNNTSEGTLCVGGIVGYIDDSKITTSYYDGSIESQISNSHTTKQLKQYIGGIAGFINNNNVNTADFVTNTISAARFKILNNITPELVTNEFGAVVGHGANLNAKAKNLYFITDKIEIFDATYYSDKNLFNKFNDVKEYTPADYDGLTELVPAISSDFVTFTYNLSLLNTKLEEIFADKTTWVVNGVDISYKTTA